MHVLAYADDVVLTVGTEKELKSTTIEKKLESWLKEKKLQLNREKSKILIAGRGRRSKKETE